MVETIQERLAEMQLTETIEEKLILDATSAFRSMWFNKNNPLVDYFDKSSDDDLNKRRSKYNNLCGTTKFRYWNPKNKTIQGTWAKLSFPDNTYKMVVFDPPHKKKLGEKSKFKQIYGELSPETWQRDLKQAFTEFFRVLQPYGFLILKWGSDDVSYKEILACSPIKPLYGNITNGTNKHKKSRTYWFCFMKPSHDVKTTVRESTKC